MTGGMPGSATRGNGRPAPAWVASRAAQPFSCWLASSDPFWNPAERESPTMTRRDRSAVGRTCPARATPAATSATPATIRRPRRPSPLRMDAPLTCGSCPIRADLFDYADARRVSTADGAVRTAVFPGAGIWATLRAIVIESLFPPGVKVVALTALPAGAELLPEEEPFVARAVEKRRRDFALGRACARAALLRLGVPAGPIPVGDERGPVWPTGVVGSLSHCAGLAVAAVARRSEFAGLGIDVEPAAPVEEKLFSQIATEQERNWLETLGPGRGEAARRLFSAKESVYKCLHPLLGVFLGFHD